MQIKQEGLRTDRPQFGPGDSVKVSVKVVEGESERIQTFDGVVISKRGHGIAETFTVRKVSFGIGVERIFPLHSPRVESIEVVKHGKIRRSKLFYLRGLTGKAARLTEKADTKESDIAVNANPEPAKTEIAQPVTEPKAEKASA